MRSEEFDGRQQILLGFAKDAQSRGDHFFYIRIPGDIEPLKRGENYEDAVHEALSIADLGEVTGGGSQLGEGNSVAFCGIDVVVRDREKGLAVIRATMRELSAPAETVIEEYLPKYDELRL